MVRHARYFFLATSIIFAILFSPACQTDKTPTGIGERISASLVGEWIHKTTPMAAGSPPEAVTGIRIYEDGKIVGLSVETATGKLVLPGTSSPGRFIHAYDGKFILEVYHRAFFMPGGTFHGAYQIENSQLSFDIRQDKVPFLASNYEKAQIGEVVTPPVHSYFEMNIGDTLLINSQISTSPSAYASYLVSNNQPFLLIRSRSGRHHVIVHVEDFQGIGNYILGTNTDNFARYFIASGDVIKQFGTDQPDAGSITFNSFDLANNTCSGSYGFEVGFHNEMLTISGNFEIPVYD